MSCANPIESDLLDTCSRNSPGMRPYWIDQPQPVTPHLIPLPRDVLGHRRHHVLEKTSSVVLRYILSCHSTTTRSLFLVIRNVSHFFYKLLLTFKAILLTVSLLLIV